MLFGQSEKRNSEPIKLKQLVPGGVISGAGQRSQLSLAVVGCRWRQLPWPTYPNPAPSRCLIPQSQPSFPSALTPPPPSPLFVSTDTHVPSFIPFVIRTYVRTYLGIFVPPCFFLSLLHAQIIFGVVAGTIDSSWGSMLVFDEWKAGQQPPPKPPPPIKLPAPFCCWVFFFPATISLAVPLLEWQMQLGQASHSNGHKKLATQKRDRTSSCKWLVGPQPFLEGRSLSVNLRASDARRGQSGISPLAG
jgi:hypothetical protein